jgi:hypothetical protein
MVIKNQPKQIVCAQWAKMQASNLKISFYFSFERARQ